MTTVGLSLLIVNYNTWRLCVDAVRSFVAHAPTHADGAPMSFEVIVVDNASPMRDAAAERELEALCAAHHGRLIRHDQNSGYSQGMNLAYRHARGRWILVSNPDLIYLAGGVDSVLRAMERDASIGAAAPKGFWDETKQGQLPPNILPTLGDLLALTLADLFPRCNRRYSRSRTRVAVQAWNSVADVELTMLSGCCFVMHRDLIDRIGFFDDRFPLYYEDTDLSVRIRQAGKRIVQVHGAEVIHLYDRSGQTDNAEKMRRYWKSRRIYFRKWYGPLGALLYDLTRKVLDSKWGQRRRGILPHRHIHDLGASHGKPVIRLDRPRGTFLVEFALDPKFFLAGGIVVHGDTWTPTDVMMRSFGPTIYWFRVVDLDVASQPVIGVWRFQQLHPSVRLPMGAEADALGRLQLARTSGAGAVT